MTINIFEWSYTLAVRSLGADLTSRAGKNSLARQVSQPLGSMPLPRSEPTPADIQVYVDLYGEQVTVDAMADLTRYFQFTQSRGFTVGGLTTRLAPLSIGPGDVRPSNTAIGVVIQQSGNFELLSLRLDFV